MLTFGDIFMMYDQVRNTKVTQSKKVLKVTQGSLKCSIDRSIKYATRRLKTTNQSTCKRCNNEKVCGVVVYWW